jgi:dihydrolipoamide dehydrogenase
MKKYDVIIVGTGAANIVADAVARQGLSLAIVEKGRFGGTCLNRGCIPTKIMITTADMLREIKEAKRIGIHVDNPSVDWDLMSKRLWEKVNESYAVRDYYAAMDNIDIYAGFARFIDNKTLHVEMKDGKAEEITADKIILGIGARTKVPKLPGLEEAGYLTSETLFGDKYPKKPYKSLIVIGGGPIGCEFSHFFDAMGSKVTIVQHNVRLLPKEDEAMSEQLLKEFRRYGITVWLNQDTTSVRVENGQKILSFRNRTTGEENEVSAEEILVAPGITPMTDMMAMENTDIMLSNSGYINTNEFLETSAAGVWALGDVNGLAPFRHKANYEAEIIAHNIFSGNAPENWRWARYDTVPAVTFTYPQVAHVGLTEAQANKAGHKVNVAINHYSASAKGYAMGITPGAPDDGFVKLIVDADTQTMLGMHIIGPQASILIQPYVNLLSAGNLKLEPLHEEIASPTVAKLRAEGYSRYLDPHSVFTVSESMTPHPSLSEVAMWTRYYYEGK